MLNKKVIVASAFPCLSGIGFLGSNPTNVHYKIMVNYNGQADLLLSLQIFPDYYPYQFKKTTLYDYLTNVNDYLVVNEHTSPEKKKLKEGLQKRLDDLLGNVKEFGPSLWNEDLYETGLVFKNDQQWSNRSTSILFLEQFIADDFVDINESTNSLPAYKDLIITNYRAARDPYTIFSKKVFKCFEEDAVKTVSSSEEQCDVGQGQGQGKQLAEKFKQYIKDYSQDKINSLYRFGKYIYFWNNLFKKAGSNLKELGVESWIKKENLFALEKEQDKEIADRYSKIIFGPEETKKLDEWSSSSSSGTFKSNYLLASNTGISLVHHPALEQTTLPGSAPLAEGSQKEVIVFLFQFAALIDEYVKRKNGNFKTDFAGDPREDFMKSALQNAKVMAKNLEDRISNIRKYFQKIEVVDPSFDPSKLSTTSPINNNKSKAFAIVTYPPSSFGAGEATIQSMSKFPFLYTDIGLRQVFPTNLKKTNGDHISWEDEIFSVDDNGWWWKIGNVNLDSSNLFQFENQADSLLVLANPEDWNLINDKNAVTLKSLGTLLKGEKDIDAGKVNKEKYPVSYNKYHLWNEGLRSPIALNLLLDNLVNIFQRQYDPKFVKSKGENQNGCYAKAMDWGNYWHEAFIAGKSCEKNLIQVQSECKVN
ncbi:iron ABC transporter substrate-binding protein [Candidatus Mycoplasma haematobovis]|uniref:Iron ABC transporter substrate-binding protein n=1 Tax=Candidatus Mycoplasma haematobovis TaxID=432608 RepID=A0A1A9QCA3_9MOLU|nr:iron ABC transporter substrate-binding protein [Candidatus Mycoplasma haematobovis]OAL10083.1 iron ABC transporter substrate-binding protein [Candidatus Mycoplasma haematobovis]